MSGFNRAVRSKVWLKLGLMGPSGAGKTYSALLLAKGLAKGEPVAGIDTENGSMSLYADLLEFDVLVIQPPFDPKKCIAAINDAVKGGYKVLVIDSATHFWKKILEDKEALDRAGGNGYTNWGKVKPKFEELKTAMLQSQIHIICCMRAKDEYVIEKNDRGKEAPRKVGMGAIMEPGAEYEYTTVFDLAMDHNATASKDRTGMFDGEIAKITPATGERFLQWLETGATPIESPVVNQEPVNVPADAATLAGLYVRQTLSMDKAQFEEFKALAEGQWVDVALEAEQRGIATLDGLMRLATEGDAPINEEVTA